MSSSSLKPESHFKIHVAKAKDLPLSWYDLVLRPEKFAEHLETLREDPEAAPTAAYLIVTFLDKADILSSLSSALSTNTEFKEGVEGEKKTKLVQCALLVASSLLWDSPQLWTELPHSVQFCLVSCLRSHYPLPEGGVTRGVVNTEAVVSHVLFSVWVLRFVVQQCYSSQAPPKHVGQTWEANCTPKDQIKDMVKSKADAAISLLVQYLEQVDSLPGSDLPVHCAVPRVGVDLQVPSGGGKLVHLKPTISSASNANFLVFLCKVRYALGCYYLVVGDFKKAQDQLQKTQEQLGHVDGSDGGGVDRGELQGYLAACKSVLQTAGGGGGGGAGRDPTAALEHHFKRQDFKAMESVLVKDLCGKDKISSATLLSLELEVVNLNLATPPDPKRSRLDPSVTVSVADRLVAYSSLKNILQGLPPATRLWRLLEEGDNYLSFLLKVCDSVCKEGLPPKKKQLLWSFLRSVCTKDKRSWEMLLRTALARQHIKRENTEGMFGPKAISFPSDTTVYGGSHSSQVDRLERKVGLATSAKEVKEAVDELWEVLPSSQHSGLVGKWLWSGKGYAYSDALMNPVALIKYNCLLHRAQAMAKFQLYQQSLELLSAALALLRTSECQSSKVRQQMEDFLQERILMLELKVFHKSGCGLDDGGCGPNGLLAKARAYYMTTQRWSAHDWETWFVVGAFLLNQHEFQFIAQQEIKIQESKSHTVESKGNTVPSTLPYKLAEAVIKTKEGKDLRKSIRSLFEAVLQVFSPPLGTSEAKSEVLEKQAKLRSNLDLFIKNLTDPTSLSLLIAGLARIWNLLKKPEEEILTDYSGHWPTAIGNASNIDAVHVLRTLNTTLSHALQLHPHSTSWILTKANTHNALCEYGAALEGYMEAAALSTNHFHAPVPEEVWPASILRRLINCCQRLNYHTQAAILCQLLQPADYDLAFLILRENASSLLENMFAYLWDMTIIEYLIHIQSKKPESSRHTAAVRVAGQADLNFHNSAEVLNRAAEVRRRKFLRTFYSQITHAL